MGDGGMDGGGYGDTWAGPEISGSGPLGTITRSGQEAAAMAMGYSSPAEAVAAESGGMANITGSVYLASILGEPQVQERGEVPVPNPENYARDLLCKSKKTRQGNR